jgi:hypothetical protein
MPLSNVSLDELIIDDEDSFSHVALFGTLKRMLRRSGHRFLIPSGGEEASWDRTVFLNLTYWNADQGADILCDRHLSADVVAHIAWHHAVSTKLASLVGVAGAKSATALFFAESIASAFDLYLVGRLLHNAPDSDFISTQVPIMAEAAEQAGLSSESFAALLAEVVRDPERAFEDLRALLVDVTSALFECRDAVSAQYVLEQFASHRFAPLLHHFQLSAWILYARAYGSGDCAAEVAPTIRALDASLRTAPVSLDWLEHNWAQ